MKQGEDEEADYDAAGKQQREPDPGKQTPKHRRSVYRVQLRIDPQTLDQTQVIETWLGGRRLK